MIWLLIITSMGPYGDTTFAPTPYPTHLACQTAGDRWMHDVGSRVFRFEGREGKMGSYACEGKR